MTKQPQRLDDYDAFDERGVLRDGKRWTVPMSFMDSMQRSVAQHFAKSPKMGDITTADHHIDLHDGHGRQPGNRPGWVMPTETSCSTPKNRKPTSNTTNKLVRRTSTLTTQARRLGQAAASFAVRKLAISVLAEAQSFPTTSAAPAPCRCTKAN